MIDQQAMNKRARARIGVIVPFSNTNLESDMILLQPAEASLHFARAGGYDLEATPDSDQMRKFALASLEPTVASLMAVRPHVILYGCTSATISHGRAFDLQFAGAGGRAGGSAGIPRRPEDRLQLPLCGGAEPRGGGVPGLLWFPHGLPRLCRRG